MEGPRLIVPVVPSEEDVLEGMLTRRFQYVFQFSYFRTKSRWELIRLSLLIVGIEFTYATETAFVAPILLGIGLPHTVMTMMWAMPPIVGVLFVPVVASASDRLRSKWGRRRPVLLALGVAMLLGMMLLPHGRLVGEAIGLRTVAWVATLTTIGLTTTDFSAEASNGLCRTYAMEVCTIGDQARVLSTMMLIGGLGGSLGYLFGAVDWSALPIGEYFTSDESAVFTANWLFLLVGLLSTLTSFPEIPLPVQERDELLRPVTKRALKNELQRLRGNVHEVQTELHMDIIGFRQFVRNVIRMPRAMRILCATQCLTNMGHLTFCLNFTDFVASTVYDGDVQAPPESLEFVLYQQGVRFACFGMALYLASASLSSLLIEQATKRVGARAVYVTGLMAHCVGMLSVGFLHYRAVVLLCCSLAGIMYATVYSIPILLISHYHSKNSFDVVDGKCVESTQPRGFGADVSILNSILCIAQLIISLVMGALIDAFGTTKVIAFAASGCSFLAACSAMTVFYMGL
uniref:Major facilitator superfamily (MFS) profile domain-containing protein n=1 Tax=Anopheles atroparvus TaxID=41427 RepID=A0AAG5DJM0_ANOAO